MQAVHNVSNNFIAIGKYIEQNYLFLQLFSSFSIFLFRFKVTCYELRFNFREKSFFLI